MADEKAELGGRILADLGAEVLRVEPPGGSASRRMPPFHGATSLYFEVRNTNKNGLVLDLSDDGGRAALVDLLAGADIWIETSRPGQLGTVGLDPRDLSARMPHLITVSVTDFGQTGPYRDYLASDAVMSALAWMLFRAGVPELPPVLPPGTLPYDMVGISAALAALTAYLDRCGTGRGQYIDMSVMEAIAQTTDWGLTSYSVIHKLGVYGEVRDGGGKAYPIIPCADGYVRPAMVTVAEWRKLRAWIGEAGIEPEVLQQDHWDDQRVRIDAFDELLRPIFVEFFKGRTMVDASLEGQARGIPITPMLTPADALGADQFEVVGSFADMPIGGDIARSPSGFLVIDGTRIGARRSAPRLGEEARPAWSARPAQGGDGRGAAGRPYQGLRVVEFGVAGAVPEIGRMLAEYGADVIRVETPKKPDLFRQLGGPSGMGSVFASSNRSTRSFGVEYTTPAGTRIVKDLIQKADVVLENLTPGTLEKFGLGPDQISRINPDALVLSSSTMGRRGPWAHWRGYGSNTQLPSGMSWLWSFPDAVEPVPQNVAFPDHFVGRLGAVAVAADLIGRRRGDAGARRVEIIQAEMALNLLAEQYVQESLAPGSVRPRGNRSPLGSPWGVYPCAGNQRWCVITCRDDTEWRGLARAMGDPEWTRDPLFAAATGRGGAADEIDRHISEWTAGREDRQVMELLQANGVPAGFMMYMSDQPEDPHLTARGYIVEIDQPGLGDILFEGRAFHADGLPGPITAPAPLLGEHTMPIWTELLGRSEAEAVALADEGLLVLGSRRS
jgi:crotonobetainyl-CoA:carnitine CoA-transferase CaiB-like acyl-CoA transferase